MISLEEICERIEKHQDSNHELIDENYIGFDFDSQNNTDSRFNNYAILINLFPEWTQNVGLNFNNFDLQSHKGTMWWGDTMQHKVMKEFNGWGTEDIILWLLKNRPWTHKDWEKKVVEEIEKQEQEEELNFLKSQISRVITKTNRYDVLKRQKWNCNQCGCKLKYSKENNWEAEVAHIDHIHPFSKKETYKNGIFNINELQNLQALCPKCNITKSDKEIQ